MPWVQQSVKSTRRIKNHERTDLHEERGYQIPNLSPTEQAQMPLGKYGRMRKNYLKEQRPPMLWNQMILSETLYPHLREIAEKSAGGWNSS